jgi:hypothetical protein
MNIMRVEKHPRQAQAPPAPPIIVHQSPSPRPNTRTRPTLTHHAPLRPLPRWACRTTKIWGCPPLKTS